MTISGIEIDLANGDLTLDVHQNIILDAKVEPRLKMMVQILVGLLILVMVIYE